jgi:hypothetical protein
MKTSRRVLACVGAAAAAVLLLSSCTTVNNLDRYRIENASLAADMREPPQARLDIDYTVHFDARNPIGTALSVGTTLIKASEAEKAEANMRDALATVDVPAIVLRETARACAGALDARLVDRGQRADYLLDLDIREYGIQAPSWGSAVTLHLRMVASLYHTRSRDIVWRRAITIDDPASPQMFGVGHIVGDIVTAGVLSSLTVDELEEGFRALALESARSLTRKLERDFYRASFR